MGNQASSDGLKVINKYSNAKCTVGKDIVLSDDGKALVLKNGCRAKVKVGFKEFKCNKKTKSKSFTCPIGYTAVTKSSATKFSEDKTFPFLVMPIGSSKLQWQRRYKAHGTRKSMPNIAAYTTRPPKGYGAVGDYLTYGETGSKQPNPLTNRAVLYVNIKEGLESKAVKAHTDLRLVWRDKSGSGGDDCSVWEPICDDSDYVALGLVFKKEHEKPKKDSSLWTRILQGRLWTTYKIDGKDYKVYKPIKGKYYLVHKRYLQYVTGVDIPMLWKAGDGDKTTFGYNSDRFHTFWQGNNSNGKVYQLNLDELKYGCCRSGSMGSDFLCKDSKNGWDAPKGFDLIGGGKYCKAENTSYCATSVFGTEGALVQAFKDAGRDADIDTQKNACLAFALKHPSPAFDEMADKYCTANPDDPFCGCNKNGAVYKALPNNTIAERQVRAFPHCFIPDCIDGKSYKMKENRKKCDPITVCTQDMGASYDGSVVGSNMQQLCGTTYKKQTVPDDSGAMDPSAELPTSGDGPDMPALTGSGEVAPDTPTNEDEVDGGANADADSSMEGILNLAALLLLICGGGLLGYLFLSGMISTTKSVVAALVLVLAVSGLFVAATKSS